MYDANSVQEKVVQFRKGWDILWHLLLPLENSTTVALIRLGTTRMIISPASFFWPSLLQPGKIAATACNQKTISKQKISEQSTHTYKPLLMKNCFHFILKTFKQDTVSSPCLRQITSETDCKDLSRRFCTHPHCFFNGIFDFLPVQRMDVKRQEKGQLFLHGALHFTNGFLHPVKRLSIQEFTRCCQWWSKPETRALSTAGHFFLVNYGTFLKVCNQQRETFFSVITHLWSGPLWMSPYPYSSSFPLGLPTENFALDM